MKVFCPTCGYANESGLGTSLTCKSCGATFELPSAKPAPIVPVPPPQPLAPPITYVPTGPVPNHPAAIASLVLGILCCIPFSAIGSLISGAIALKAIQESNGQYRGRELAIAGMVLGALSIVLVVVSVIISAVTQPH